MSTLRGAFHKLANSNEEKKLPIQIDWLLDAFANCPPLDDIEAIVSVSRSRGMRFHFFIQSFSQLDNVYGKEVAQIILDTNTQETAEAISKRLGKKTIESTSISQSVSKLDYNGNQSISLMGRELLTPEEVKQLHFKTIIFPTIGFPILRNTVLYKKFSCYQKVEVERHIRTLKDLSYTYYTVEQINNRLKKQKQKPDVISNNEEVNDFYQEIKIGFNDILEQIKLLLDNQQYEVDFPMNNGMMYCSIKLNDLLCEDDKFRINELNNDKYHIEIDMLNDKNIINIHNKGVN